MSVVVRVTIAALVLLAIIQVVRPARSNPSINPDRTLAAQLPAAHPAVPVIARACQNCHSSGTSWPWYSGIAPVSWMVARHVDEARRAVNFSTWADYPAEQQRKILKESCEEVRQREMPLRSYVLLHPEATLNAVEVRAICDLSPSL